MELLPAIVIYVQQVPTNHFNVLWNMRIWAAQIQITFVGVVHKVRTVSLEVLPAQIVLHLAIHFGNPRALQAARATRDILKIQAQIRLRAKHHVAPQVRLGLQAAAHCVLRASTRQCLGELLATSATQASTPRWLDLLLLKHASAAQQTHSLAQEVLRASAALDTMDQTQDLVQYVLLTHILVILEAHLDRRVYRILCLQLGAAVSGVRVTQDMLELKARPAQHAQWESTRTLLVLANALAALH
jgi:hypothetical protein